MEAQFVTDLYALSYTTGDILYYDGTKLNRLPIGSSTNVLTVSGGIPSWAAPASGGHTIEDEGTPLTQRANMNFTGAGVTVTDSGSKTVVNIPGGGGTWGSITGTLSSQTDLQTALDGKVDENVAITGATKTKITYDAKGLVTAGADATTADIADSTNKRYVTDAQLTVISNTSGTNTGNQTSIVGISGTKTEFDTALTDGNFLYVGDVTSNATHTGEVTGATTLTVDKTAITNKTLVTAAVGDHILIADASDTDNLKKVTVQTIVDLAAAGGNNYFNDIYIDQSGGTSDTYGVLSGSVNGSNTLFTVSQSAYATGTLQVWLNGQLQTQGAGEDYVETTPASGTFTFATAPITGDLITVSYQKVVTNSSTIVTTSTVTELAQDAVGAMVDTTLTYVDGTPLLQRAALTGAITASAGSNTTALGSFTKSQLDTAVSDGNILYVGDITQYTDELAQDAIGAMVANSTFVNLTYVDGTPSLTASLSATGTPSASTYLRGDNTWATVTTGGNVSKVGTPADNQIGVWTGDGTIEGDAKLTFNTATDHLHLSGAPSYVDTNNYLATFESTDAGANGAYIALYHNSASPLATDGIGGFDVFGRDSANNIEKYSQFNVDLVDPTSTSEDSKMRFDVMFAGTLRTELTVGDGVIGISVGDGNNAGVVESKDNQDLILQTGNATTGNITIVNGANGNINLSPDGIGIVSVLNNLEVLSNNTGASGAVLDLYQNSASPAALDTPAKITFSGKDSASNKQQYAAIEAYIDDTTSGSEDATLALTVVSGGQTGIGRKALLLEGAVFRPESNDSISLGRATVQFSDLFLASGGVINFANGNATLTHSTGLLTSSVDIVVPDEAYGAGWNGSLEVPTKNAVYDKIESMSGISRSVTVTSGSITAGSAAATDYIYFVSGAHTISMPAASGNTNRYTIKNTHSANITVDTVGTETIEGAASISIAPSDSVDIISNGTNYFII